jgi:hypothetical protein
MESRFISVVAFYGPKTGRLRELLTGVQALIAEHVGNDFRPYTLDQVHATLIALNGVRAGGRGRRSRSPAVASMWPNGPSRCKAKRSCWWDGRPNLSPAQAAPSTTCAAR